MEKNASIYIAGHRGMVGSAIVRRLQAGGYANILTRTHAELDLLDQRAVFDFLAAEKPDYIFLAAAKVGGIQANNTYRADFIYQNLMIEANLIHGAHQAGIERLCFLGSSCIYPRDCQQPIKEEYLLTGPLEQTNEPYAIAKIAGIKLCESYNRQYGRQYVSAMPTNLYGPNDNYDLANSHVLPALIRKCHLAKLASERNAAAIEADEAARGPIPADLKQQLLDTCTLNLEPCLLIWGSGKPMREFLHVDDMADACVFLMELSASQPEKIFPPRGSSLAPCPLPLEPVFNVGTGTDVTIRELAETIMEVVGFKGEITFDASKPDGTPRKLLDVSRLKALGWQVRIGLRDGIRATYESFLAP